jgi:hypothetical protein
MKMRAVLALAFALNLCLALPAHDAAAQQPQSQRAPDKLVVQIEYFKGAPPAYESVPGTAWYARFGRTPAADTRAPADTVLAVDVTTRADGGRVEIKVGVHVGAQHFDRLDAVGTYRASVGEDVTAGDLERFGVAPFRMKVLRIGETSNAAPVVVNRTQSIEAAVTDFKPEPLPRATVTLRNLSSKRVRAVELRLVVDGRESVSSFLAEREGKMLIEPGATFDKKVGVTKGRATQTDFTPQTVESVVVSSAVFDDYTYEGDAHTAARKRAMDEGERAQLPRLVSLIREAHSARASASTPEAVRSFKAKLSALDDDAPARSVDAIMKAYTELKPGDRELVEAAMSVAMHAARRELLDDLARFEEAYARSPAENDFDAWLKSRQARFGLWLSRL